jgi:ketosteroid isomerase-like protein
VGFTGHETDTLSVARRLFETFAKGGLETIAPMLHPDVSAHPGIDGAPTLEGRAAVVDWWADIARRGTELEARPLDFEVHGETVIVRGYLRHRDGRTLAENQVFWLFEVRDGLIARMESFPSRSAALAGICERDSPGVAAA